MQHKSTFNLMVGSALVQQFDVRADIERDENADWFVGAVYADPIEVDGVCPEGECYVEIPAGHWLLQPVRKHFETQCRDKIEALWAEHLWDEYPSTIWVDSISAGRSL